jgi:UbiD family decarboxylase
MVFTKNPETGKRNCGMYRMQVYDARTTGMHWQAHKQGAEHYLAPLQGLARRRWTWPWRSARIRR